MLEIKHWTVWSVIYLKDLGQESNKIKISQSGDQVLLKATKESEELNIDMVWNAVDWYRKAVISTREIQVGLKNSTLHL